MTFLLFCPMFKNKWKKISLLNSWFRIFFQASLSILFLKVTINVIGENLLSVSKTILSLLVSLILSQKNEHNTTQTQTLVLLVCQVPKVWQRFVVSFVWSDEPWIFNIWWNYFCLLSFVLFLPYSTLEFPIWASLMLIQMQ